MGVLTTEVEVSLSGLNISHYEILGYTIPRYKDSHNKMSVKRGTKIIVKVIDLQDGSSVIVDVECDECHKIYNKTWGDYKRYEKEDNKHYCGKCASRLFGIEKTRKIKLAKGISFEQLCIDNCSKEKVIEISLRWNAEKNGCLPSEVSCSSNGINKKGFWFKCLDHPEHKSELKCISHFKYGRPINLDCNQCNTIALTNPELIKYYVNIEDTNKYSAYSMVIVDMICPNCGYIKRGDPCHLTTQGFSCIRCSDHISYPEKIMFSVLEQSGLNFKSQLTKTTFKWCGNYKYDFYIPLIGIIETSGMQHYGRGFSNIKTEKSVRTLQEEQENDATKEKLALGNGIKNYIIVDCRKSDLEFIKNNIMHSKLIELFNLSKIDWLKCEEYACSSLVKTVCDLWNNGFKNAQQISDKTNHTKGTIIKYLKQGTKLGWCIYNPEEEMKLMCERKYKKVICLNTNEVFDSVAIGALNYNIGFNNVATCCRGMAKSSGKHPITGEKLVWQFYEEYLKSNNSNII